MAIVRIATPTSTVTEALAFRLISTSGRDYDSRGEDYADRWASRNLPRAERRDAHERRSLVYYVTAATTFTITPDGNAYSIPVTVPPGSSTVLLTTDAPEVRVGYRDLSFNLVNAFITR